MAADRCQNLWMTVPGRQGEIAPGSAVRHKVLTFELPGAPPIKHVSHHPSAEGPAQSGVLSLESIA
jgi:hypothetical protein